MGSTEVAQCIIYSGKIYVQKISSTVSQLIYKISAEDGLHCSLQIRHLESLWPTIRPVGWLPVILGKTLLYFVTLPPMRMSSIFLWPFSLWTKRRPSTVLIGLPFCLWASAPLLLAGLNFCILRIFVVLSLLTVMYHRL